MIGLYLISRARLVKIGFTNFVYISGSALQMINFVLCVGKVLSDTRFYSTNLIKFNIFLAYSVIHMQKSSYELGGGNRINSSIWSPSYICGTICSCSSI